MLIQKEQNEGQIVIKSYQPGRIRLNIGPFEQPILLQNGILGDASKIADFDQLKVAQLTALIEQKPEVFIVGSGPTHKMLPQKLIKQLNDQGIAVEAMASRQACHTYQVLIYEKRRVFALIYP